MVQLHPADEGAERRLPAQTLQAEHQTAQRGQAADAGHPQQGLAPQIRLLAQRREVEPVRHRAQPVPQPLAPGGVAHHFATACRHVQFGAGGIVQRDAVEGALAVQRGEHGPLVAFHGAGPAGPLCTGEGTGDRFGAYHVDRVNAGTGLRAHRVPAAVGLHHAPDRFVAAVFAHQRFKPEPARKIVHAGGAQCGVRRHPQQAAVEWRQSAQPLGVGQRREADHAHDQAGQEPHQEQQTAGDAQPAVHCAQGLEQPREQGLAGEREGREHHAGTARRPGRSAVSQSSMQ